MLNDARGLADHVLEPHRARDLRIASLLDLWNYRIDAPKTLKGALEHDADFPMAHIVRGYIMSMLESVVVQAEDARVRGARASPSRAGQRP